MDIIKAIEHEQLKSKVTELRIGNTVRVHVRIKEGNKERIQVFEGIIIKKQGSGVNETFTVRRISYGVGVEKTFLVHSPRVEKIEVVRVGKARRAKLYYLRDRIGKAAKTKEQVGARIETKEIVVKEELVPGESEVVENADVVESTEAVATEETNNAEATEIAEVNVEEKVEAKTEEVAETKAEEITETKASETTVENAEKTESAEAKKEGTTETESK